MDWSKAKTILIAAFLITDLILVALIAWPMTRADARADHANDQILLEVLARNNVFLAAEIPSGNGELPVLYGRQEALDKERTRALLDRQTPVPAADDAAYIEAAKAFIKEAGLTDGTLVFETIEKAEGRVTVFFGNRINEMPIEKSGVVCVFREKALTEFEYDWFRVEGFNNKKQRTISAADALLVFMSAENREADEKRVVEEIKIVYWLGESGVGANVIADTAIPAWKIVYNDGETAYINAYEQ